MSSEVSSSDLDAAAQPLVIVGGPTASGKSALALALAEALDGAVINADSMQVYAELDVLTARPGSADLTRSPHRLYGVLPVSEVCSAVRWRAMALAEIDEARRAGRLPIVCGGTGFYLRALTHGISAMPDIPEAVRAATRRLHGEIGGAEMRRRLAERDPATAARLDDGDSQRLMRAYEVVEATGRPLSEWQRLPPSGAGAFRTFTVVIQPERRALYAACDARFRAMVERGAVEEVRALLALGLDPALPAMKALGVPSLAGFIEGKQSLDEAIEEAQRETRRYAKRQMTWFRNQVRADLVVFEQYSERTDERIFSKIRQFLLTGGT